MNLQEGLTVTLPEVIAGKTTSWDIPRETDEGKWEVEDGGI